MDYKVPEIGGTTRAVGAATPGLLDEWMSRAELAGELGISEDTLSRWETRRIGPPCVRVGRKVLYRRGAVQDWLKAQEDRAAKGRGR
ncbi:MAG: helix-turn-helix domain-containing protein [Mesorhizobium sp.]